MGKRKSSKKPQTKKGPAPLDKTFRCLFCQHANTVTCKIDKSTKIGRLDCKNCGQNFSASVTHLTQPIDLYTDWIDAADEVNKDQAPSEPLGAPPGKRRRVQREDDVEEDERDQQAGYEDDEDQDQDARPSQRRRQRVDDDDDDNNDGGAAQDLPDAL